MHDEYQNFVPPYDMYPAQQNENYLVHPSPMGYQDVGIQQHPGHPPRGFLQHALRLLQPRSDLTFPVLSIVLSQGNYPKVSYSKRCSINAKCI